MASWVDWLVKGETMDLGRTPMQMLVPLRKE